MNIAFCHNIEKNNNFTIAYGKKKTDETTEIHLGFSFCSDQDRYEKRLGRAISKGRLTSAPLTVYGLEDASNNDIIKFAISLIDKYGKDVLGFEYYDAMHGLLA